MSLIFIIIIFCSYFDGFLYIEPLPKILDNLCVTSNENKEKSNELPKLASNGEGYSNYNLSVIFNPSTSSVTGNITVDFYNNDNIILNQIPFHLFLSGMQYVSRKGSINILSVTTLNEPKTPIDYDEIEEEQLLWVNFEPILGSLNPFQRVKFVIAFHSVIPDGGIDRANSHGFDSDNSRIYKFTSFYPMPCVYDKYDGWNTDPYIGSCDPFYHDMADYNLFIEAPDNIMIIATGKMIQQTIKGSNIIYHFKPEKQVREVTFSASKWYIPQSTLINGVTISTYYLQKSSLLWENYALEYAVDAFKLFNDTFGSYPYSTLNIVEEYSNYGGMEYPLQVYASEGINNNHYLEKVIVHEIAHQWWYNLVGFDEIDWGFLDEGLTCWSTDYYARHYYSDWTYFQYTRYYDKVREYYATEGLPSKINQSAYDIIQNNLDWVFISYYKSPLIFEKISRTIGQGNFTLGLKTFFNEYKYKIAQLTDLQDVFEVIVNDSLDWLFFPWFDNDFLPKYRFNKYSYDKEEYLLTIEIEDQNENVNQYIYRQQARLQVYDTEDTILYDELIWINSTTIFEILLLGNPHRIRLVYGNDVIVQLKSAATTYIEVFIKESVPLIYGYEVNLLLIVSLLSIIYLIYKKLIKRKYLNNLDIY